MYSIKMTCYDFGNPTPYEDTPSFNPKFDTEENAIGYMRRLAMKEAEGLNEGCVHKGLTSFGVVEDEDNPIITVNCYMLSCEEDTTGETEPVTIYKVVTETAEDNVISDTTLSYISDHCSEPYDYAMAILSEYYNVDKIITAKTLFDYLNEAFGYKYSRAELMDEVEEALENSGYKGDR